MGLEVEMLMVTRHADGSSFISTGETRAQVEVKVEHLRCEWLMVIGYRLLVNSYWLSVVRSEKEPRRYKRYELQALQVAQT